MCYLRGIVYNNTSHLDRAKECFKEALQIDVKCYDALDNLISNSMMTTSEERELIEEIMFDKQLHDADTAFVEMLYQSKLKKVSRTTKERRIVKLWSVLLTTDRIMGCRHDHLDEQADLQNVTGQVSERKCRPSVLQSEGIFYSILF